MRGDVTFSMGQITRLYELERARLRGGGEGLHDLVQELIRRIESGGVMPTTTDGARFTGDPQHTYDRDPRVVHAAKRLWDRGFGREIGRRTFAEYLLDIPDIPTFPASWDARFPHLVLVDRRVNIMLQCRLLGVRVDWWFHACMVPYDPEKSEKEFVYWMRCSDGRGHQKYRPVERRAELATTSDEAALDAYEGLACYAADPAMFGGSEAVDLLGVTNCNDRSEFASIWSWSSEDRRMCVPFDDGGVRPSSIPATRGHLQLAA